MIRSNRSGKRQSFLRGSKHRLCSYPYSLLCSLPVIAAITAGCGLSGGSIPPGQVPGVITLPFTVTGRVARAVTPYAAITSAMVSVQKADGTVVAGPAPVFGDGTFSFSNVPGGALMLRVTATDPSLRPVAIPFSYTNEGVVQFVVSAPPVNYTPPTSITLAADNPTPGLHQLTQVHAHLTGSVPPDLAPSWVAFGNSGFLSAIGPVAQFNPQAAGPEALVAVSENASTAVTLTVPNSAPGVSGGNTPPGPPDFTAGSSAGTGSSKSGSPTDSGSSSNSGGSVTYTGSGSSYGSGSANGSGSSINAGSSNSSGSSSSSGISYGRAG